MLYYRIACYLLMFTAASHLAGHFYLVPQFQLVHPVTGGMPANETEHRLLTLMNDYHKRIGGSALSMMDIQNGLSLAYSLFFLWLGALNLLLLKPIRRNHRLLARISFLNVAMLAIGVVISFLYFFWLPVVSFFAILVFFLIAGIQYGRSNQF